MKNRWLFALVLFALAALPAHAQSTDGNDLIVKCGVAVNKLDDPHKVFPWEDLVKVEYCTGIVHGVADALGDSIAPPQNVNVGQCIRIVEKYLQDHPEDLSEPDTRLAIRALKKAFPVK